MWQTQCRHIKLHSKGKIMPWQHATWLYKFACDFYIIWCDQAASLLSLYWHEQLPDSWKNKIIQVRSAVWPGCRSPRLLSRHTLTGVRRIQEPVSKICNRWSESTAISPENSAKTRNDNRSYMMWLPQTHTPSSRSYFSTVFPVCHVSPTANCIKPPLCSCNEVGSVRVYTEASHQDFCSGS